MNARRRATDMRLISVDGAGVRRRILIDGVEVWRGGADEAELVADELWSNIDAAKRRRDLHRAYRGDRATLGLCSPGERVLLLADDVEGRWLVTVGPQTEELDHTTPVRRLAPLPVHARLVEALRAGARLLGASGGAVAPPMPPSWVGGFFVHAAEEARRLVELGLDDDEARRWWERYAAPAPWPAGGEP